MRFDPTRCAHCGGPPLVVSSVQGLTSQGRFSTGEDFFFCSDDCLEAELNKFLPKQFAIDKAIADDPTYKQLVADRDDYFARCWPNDRIHSNEEIQHRLRDENGEQRVIERFAETWLAEREKEVRKAVHRLLETWRSHTVQQREKERLKEQEQLDKQQAKETAEAAEKAAFEELLKPRPIPELIRFDHTHILGPSGSGKTTLIQQIVLDDLAKPSPPAYVIIDPKGSDLVEPLSRLAVFNQNLRDRLVIVDPFDIPALNLFHSTSNLSETISNFSYIFSTSKQMLTGPQESCFSFCIRLLFNMKSPNLFTLLDLLDDDERHRDPRFISALANLNSNENADAITRRFFEKDYYSSTYSSTREQIKTRVYSIARDDYLGAMFNAPERKLDIAQCIRDRKIVLVNTRIDKLHANHQTLGRYIISLFSDAVMSRTETHSAFLVIDEFQEFADADKLPRMLRLMRSKNAGAILAHHNMYNDVFDDAIRSAISTNTGIKYASKPGGMDINYMARDMQCAAEFLTRRCVKSATHARFGCTFTGLEHPFLAEIPFQHIKSWPTMTNAQHDALLVRNKQLLQTHKAPEGVMREELTPSAEVGTSSTPRKEVHPAPRPDPPSAPDIDSGTHTDPATKWGD